MQDLSEIWESMHMTDYSGNIIECKVTLEAALLSVFADPLLMSDAPVQALC